MQAKIRIKTLPTGVEREGTKAIEKAYDAIEAAAKEAGAEFVHRLYTGTPAEQYPFAANPPERRETGNMMSSAGTTGVNVVVADKQAGVYKVQVGYHGADIGDDPYIKYQEEGWDHVFGKKIAGLNALNVARLALERGLNDRGIEFKHVRNG